MGISKIHQREQQMVQQLNSIGWKVTWSGGGYSHYDAKGLTQLGNPCVIEMKFRNKYYETKMLETYKYDKLMEISDDVLKIYLVNDPNGTYLFFLEYILLPKPVERYCPNTTLWSKGSKNKEVYLLNEDLAGTINF